MIIALMVVVGATARGCGLSGGILPYRLRGYRRPVYGKTVAETEISRFSELRDRIN